MAYTHLDPGRELEVSAHIYYCDSQSGIPELVKLSMEELKALEQDSIEQEKAIYAKLLAEEKEWTQQAGKTLALRKAQAYLKTPPVQHTFNQWVAGQYDWHEMSNMVYKFTWRTYENTRWDRTLQKSVMTSWELSWYLTYNTTHEPDDTGPGRQIAGQERKRFGDLETLNKYLQGRINAYAHLFTEISPPIPQEQQGRFCVNGVLLPGYTVEAPVEPDQNTVSALLELLGDEDIPAEGQEKKPEKPVLTRKMPHAKAGKKKHAPTR
jgi:hypothetical protein